MCWVTDFKLLGAFMIFPTIIVAILITWQSRRINVELWHNLAVVCWICANSIWMIGEFFYHDTTRPFAIAFFIAGFLCLAYYYFISEPFWRVKENIEA